MHGVGEEVSEVEEEDDEEGEIITVLLLDDGGVAVEGDITGLLLEESTVDISSSFISTVVDVGIIISVGNPLREVGDDDGLLLLLPFDDAIDGDFVVLIATPLSARNPGGST